MMLKSIAGLALLGAAISGCTENPRANSEAAAPAAVPAAAPAANVLEGAAVGAPIAGMAGAIWADPNNTGYVTGYTYKGQYHVGAPPGYDPARQAVVSPH